MSSFVSVCAILAPIVRMSHRIVLSCKAGYFCLSKRQAAKPPPVDCTEHWTGSFHVPTKKYLRFFSSLRPWSSRSVLMGPEDSWLTTVPNRANRLDSYTMIRLWNRKLTTPPWKCTGDAKETLTECIIVARNTRWLILCNAPCSIETF